MALEPYFADDTVTLYLGDCRDVLPALGVTADLVLADPPYGETSLAWDRWPDGWVKVAADVAKSLWCFGSMRMFLQHGREFEDAGWRLSQGDERYAEKAARRLSQAPLPTITGEPEL